MLSQPLSTENLSLSPRIRLVLPDDRCCSQQNPLTEKRNTLSQKEVGNKNGRSFSIVADLWT